MKYAKIMINIAAAFLLLGFLLYGLTIYSNGLLPTLTYFLNWIPPILILLFIINPNWLAEAYPQRFAAVKGYFQVDGAIGSSIGGAVLPPIFALVMIATIIAILIDTSDRPLVIPIFIFAVSTFAFLRWSDHNVVQTLPRTNGLKFFRQILALGISLVLTIWSYSIVGAYWQRYSQFNTGVTTQATILYRRFDARANATYVIYHFADVDHPETDYVVRDRGNMAVNSKVDIVYTRDNPLISTLAENLQIPFLYVLGLILFSATSIVLVFDSVGQWFKRGLRPPRARKFAPWLSMDATYLSAVMLASVTSIWLVRVLITNETGEFITAIIIIGVLLVLGHTFLLRPTLSTGGRIANVAGKVLGKGVNDIGLALSALFHELVYIAGVVIGSPLRWLFSGIVQIGRWIGALVSYFLIGLVTIVNIVVGVPLRWLAKAIGAAIHALNILWHGLLTVVSVLVRTPLLWLYKGAGYIGMALGLLLYMILSGMVSIVRILIGVPLGWIKAGFGALIHLVRMLWHGLAQVAYVLIALPLRWLYKQSVQIGNRIGALVHFFLVGLLRIIRLVVGIPLGWINAGFGALIHLVRMLWHGLAQVAYVLVALPLRWLYKQSAQIGNRIGALVNFFLVGLLSVIRILIGVPVGWIKAGFGALMHLVRMLWHGVVQVAYVLIALPLHWLYKEILWIGNFLAALLNYFRVGVFTIVRVVIGVPLSWLVKGLGAAARVLSGLWSETVRIVTEGISVCWRWLRKGFVPLRSILLVLICVYLIPVFVSTALASWNQYNQYTLTGQGFVVNTRQDAANGISYITYRYSVAGQPYEEEVEGNLALDSRVDVVYTAGNPSISTLAAYHQAPTMQTALLTVGIIVCLLITLYFLLLIYRLVFRRIDRMHQDLSQS